MCHSGLTHPSSGSHISCREHKETNDGRHVCCVGARDGADGRESPPVTAPSAPSMSSNSLLLSTSATPLSSSALLPPSTAESATSSANLSRPGTRGGCVRVAKLPPYTDSHLVPSSSAPAVGTFFRHPARPTTASSFALGAYSRDTFTWSRRSLPRPSTAATDTGRFSLADSSVSDPRHPALRAEGADAEWRPPPPRTTPKPARRSKAAFSAGAFRREEPLGAAHHLGPGHYSAGPARPAAARPSSAFASSPVSRMVTNRPADRYVRAPNAGFSPRGAAAPRRRAFAPRGPTKRAGAADVAMGRARVDAARQRPPRRPERVC